MEGIRLGPRNQAKNPPRTNDARGERRRQQSIGGAPLAFRYEEIVHLKTGPVFVQLATALLVGQGKRAAQLRGVSLREIKEDIKVLLLIRYKRRGFKFPRLVYLDMRCNDREVFMEVYEELRAMGLEMEVEDETPADVVIQLHLLSTLAPLHSTHHTTQVHSAQRRAARTLQPRRECIWSPAGQQDQEALPLTGGVGRC